MSQPVPDRNSWTYPSPTGTPDKWSDSNPPSDDWPDGDVPADKVVTASIKDGSVTKAKLAADVQASLGKADTALQSIATGSVTKAKLETALASVIDSALQPGSALDGAKLKAKSVAKTALADAVQTSLGKADTSVQPVSGKTYGYVPTKPASGDLDKIVAALQAAGILLP